MITNIYTPSKIIFGKNSSIQLINIIKRDFDINECIFLIDKNFYKKNPNSSLVKFLNTQKRRSHLLENSIEPKTDFVDNLMIDIKKKYKKIRLVVGVGGGSTLDIAKSVSNLLTNKGKSSSYQGWDLLKIPGVYKIGIPTISGTGAESSKTCVLTNEKTLEKLGMNSKFSVFNQLILDPSLTATVPKKQYFYTAMDAYIHSIESLRGHYRNPISDNYSKLTINLVKEIFLDKNPKSIDNREKLMLASLYGGLSISSSYVGLIHPISAALSVVYKLPHCFANCLAFKALRNFYHEDYKLFSKFLKKSKITIPKFTKKIDDTTMHNLIKSTLVHQIPLINAVGKKNISKVNFDFLKDIFLRV